MSERYNCPNCAAPIGYSPRCQYCGTRLDWVPIIAVNFTAEPRNVKKLVGRVMRTRSDIELLGTKNAQLIAERELAAQFAQKVPEIWEMKIEDNPIIDGKDYCATVYVYAKEERK